jgi:hypothetical protein
MPSFFKNLNFIKKIADAIKLMSLILKPRNPVLCIMSTTTRTERIVPYMTGTASWLHTAAIFLNFNT